MPEREDAARIASCNVSEIDWRPHGSSIGPTPSSGASNAGSHSDGKGWNATPILIIAKSRPRVGQPCINEYLPKSMLRTTTAGLTHRHPWRQSGDAQYHPTGATSSCSAGFPS
jgi:hypothetical protein